MSAPEIPSFSEGTARTTHAVYNFDHGLTFPMSIPFGPYKLHVKSEHTDRDILARGALHTYVPQIFENGEFRNEVTSVPPNPGRWAPTAELEDHPDLHRISILLPEVPNRTEIDDVAFILSFLTGRSVVIGNDVKQDFWLRSGEPIVSQAYFEAPQIDWSALSSLAGSAGAHAMYVVCLGMSHPELLAKFAFASAALDELSGDWYRVHGKSRYDKRTKERFDKARPTFEAALRAEGVDDALIADMMPRLANVCSESAVSKLHDFLVAHGMFPAGGPEQASARLRTLNKHRNAVLHTSRISVVNELSFDRNTQIAGTIAILMLMISRVYASKFLLGINDEHGIEEDLKTVISFFETGRFRGHDVFNESFEDHLTKLEESWITQGWPS